MEMITAFDLCIVHFLVTAECWRQAFGSTAGGVGDGCGVEPAAGASEGKPE